MIASPPRHVVLGMAGHIDHGKTALVKALTGIDTDRLKEEKERGMTTDLGFAFLGKDAAIIDVPGHERFVKTMVAGVNSIDVALLVIAADDGVMPQTREHLEILRILQIPKGLVILNKTDLVEKDWAEMVTSDIRSLVAGTFLEGAPVMPVSAVTGDGIPALADAIRQIVHTVPTRRDKGVFRMPIDRVFSIKGFGTVIAGTVLSGTVRVEDTLELLPQGVPVRVRGIQVHDESVQESGIGLRTAINLHGAEKEAVERGHVVAAPGCFTPTFKVDARVCYLASAPAPLAHRARVRIHLGTSEVVARAHLIDAEVLRPGDGGLVQLHFEQPVVADHGDRFVMRAYSPVTTIGGGEVLDPHPLKHKRFDSAIRDQLLRLGQGDPTQVVLDFLLKQTLAPCSTEETAHATSMPYEVCRAHLATLEQRSEAVQIIPEHWSAAATVARITSLIVESLTRFHRENPLRLGIPLIELISRMKPSPERTLCEHAVHAAVRRNAIHSSGGKLSLSTHTVHLSPDQERVRQAIEHAYLETPLMPPGAAEIIRGAGKDGEKILGYLVEKGDLIRMEEGIIMHRKGVDIARRKLEEFFCSKAEGTLSEIRQHLGITRKYAVPLMVHFDGMGFTRRDGEVRRRADPALSPESGG
jgi:selenocysteine-specific elongation factor